MNPGDSSMQFYKIRDAKQMLYPDGVTEFLPEVYHKYVPDDCKACGQDMVINRARTVMKCSNPKCIRRVSMIVVKCLGKLGVVGMGPATVIQHMLNHNQTRITEFLKDPPLAYRGAVKDALSKRVTFAAAVNLLCIPQIQERSYVVFSTANSYDEFVAEAAKKGGIVPYLSSKLGGSGVLVGTVQKQIFAYYRDLRDIPSVFNLRPANLEEIPIAITGGVKAVVDGSGRSYSKRDFIDALNTLLEPQGKVFRLQQGVTRQTRILVADSNEHTGNYTTALSYIEAAERAGREPTIVITRSDFLLAQVQEDLEAMNRDCEELSDEVANGDEVGNDDEQAEGGEIIEVNTITQDNKET